MLGNVLNNRYTIVAKVGKGAMGIVYRAIDGQTDEEVAVKVLNRDLALEPAILERFRREGEALRQLRHPNIVGFVDMFDHDEQHVIVMEYVPGGNLHQLIRQGPLPVDRARRIALELCDALTRAHHMNIIHRDLKPENVLLGADGAAKLTDFGVARLVSEGARLTNTGTQVGTPYYMAPEAWEGMHQDAQADVWALGVVLFEMLTGQVPFSGDTLVAVMNKVLNAPLPDVCQLRSEVPPGLAQIVAGMLTRDKTRRYATIRLVAADLERGEPLATTVTPLPPTQVAPKPRRARLPGWAWVAGPLVVVALLAGGGLLAAQRFFPVREPTPTPIIIRTYTPAATLSPVEQGLTATPCGKADLCLVDYQGRSTALGLENQFGLIDKNSSTSWSPDGQRIAFIACPPNEMSHPQSCRSLYTTDQKGQNVTFVLGHTLAEVRGASWSPDGEWIAVAEAGQLALVRPDGTGHRFLYSDTKVIQSAWSPDGLRLAFIKGGKTSALEVWTIGRDGGQARLIYQDPSQTINREQVQITWSPDGKSVAYADESGNAYLVEADCPAGPDGCLASARTPFVRKPGQARLPAHWMADFYPQWAGETRLPIATTGPQPTQAPTATQGLEPTQTLAPTLGATPTAGPAMAPTPATAYLSAKLLWTQSAAGTVYAVAWSPDGQHLAAGSAGGTVPVWGANGEAQHKLALNQSVYSVAWSPDGRQLAAAAAQGILQIWDTGNWNRLRNTHPFSNPDTPADDVTWSPDGTLIAANGFENGISVLQAATGQISQTFNAGAQVFWGFDWNPVTPEAVGCGADGQLRVWDVIQGQERSPYVGEGTKRCVVKWSPKGDNVAAGWWGNTAVHQPQEMVPVWAWRAGQAQPWRKFMGHVDGVTGIAWSPDGTRLATSSLDGSVWVWDIASGEMVLKLSEGGKKAIMDVAWSSDGTRLAAGGEEGVVWVWELTQAKRDVAEQARAFAEPILNVIASRAPDFADDFASAAKSRQNWALNEAQVQTDTLWVQSVATSPSFQVRDFALQYDLRAQPSAIYPFTMQFRFTHPSEADQSCYALSIDPATKHWLLESVKGPHTTATELASGQADMLGFEQWNRVLLVGLGDQFALYLNDAPLAYFQDSANQSGNITLVGDKRTLSYEIDNVKFWNFTKTPALQARAFAEPILAAIASRPPDYADDFSALKSGWPTGSNAAESWGYQDGIYFIQEGLADQFRRAAPPASAPVLKDFVLEVEGQLTTPQPASWYVEFRSGKTGTYAVNIGPGPQLSFFKMLNQKSTTFIDGLHASAIQPDTDRNRLMIIARDGQFAIYANGEPVWLQSDADFQQGTFALAAKTNSANPIRVHFDNLRIWDLAKAPGLP